MTIRRNVFNVSPAPLTLIFRSLQTHVCIQYSTEPMYTDS